MHHRSISRVLSDTNRSSIRTVISLRTWSPTPCSSLPAASWSRWTPSRCLFGLAPTGVCRAAPVTRCAVSSYLTFSTLPDPTGKPVGHRRCVFCGTVRRAINCAPRCYLAACPWSPDFPRGEPSCRLESRSRPSDRWWLEQYNDISARTQAAK